MRVLVDSKEGCDEAFRDLGEAASASILFDWERGLVG
jgi:hypothetical protein